MNNRLNFLKKVWIGFLGVFRFSPSTKIKPMSNNNDPLGLEPAKNIPAASPERASRELAQLNALADQLNKAAEIPPSSIPKEEAVPIVARPTERPSPAVNRQPAPFQIPNHAPIAPFVPAKVEVLTPPKPKAPPMNPELIFYTGRLKAGKDFVAAQTGATIFGFADPLYDLRKHFFGEVDKDKHGARELLQIMGQWGRGEVSEKYPLTPARAAFTKMIRDAGKLGDFGDWSVDWDSFGRNPNIWLDSMLARVTTFREDPDNDNKRVACVNVRFANEHKALTDAGWTHFHVMCSAPTWDARIRAAGIDPKSPALIDVSEQMAINLDRQATQMASRRPTLRLRCIWSDDKMATSYSGAFHTVSSFLQDLEIFSQHEPAKP